MFKEFFDIMGGKYNNIPESVLNELSNDANTITSCIMELAYGIGGRSKIDIAITLTEVVDSIDKITGLSKEDN